MIFNPIIVKGGGQEAPTIEVSDNGLITATAGGQVAKKQLPTVSANTIVPGVRPKIAAAAGVYATGLVKVAGSANLVAANIKKGVTIFGVTGTYTGGSSGGGVLM